MSSETTERLRGTVASADRLLRRLDEERQVESANSREYQVGILRGLESALFLLGQRDRKRDVEAEIERLRRELWP